jgi:transposase
MGKPHPEQLRRAVVQAIAEGRTRKEVAETYKISLSSVARFLRCCRANGDVRPRKIGGGKAYALKEHEGQIKAWIAEWPEITLAELEARLKKQNIVVSKSSIARFLDYLYRGSGGERTAGRRRGRTSIRGSKAAQPAKGAPDASAHPTQFKPGQPRPPRSGRSAGTPNKSTTILREALLLAAEQAGGHAGDGELVDYLTMVADKHPKVFLSLLRKQLPRPQRPCPRARAPSKIF